MRFRLVTDVLVLAAVISAVIVVNAQTQGTSASTVFTPVILEDVPPTLHIYARPPVDRFCASTQIRLGESVVAWVCATEATHALDAPWSALDWKAAVREDLESCHGSTASVTLEQLPPSARLANEAKRLERCERSESRLRKMLAR